MVSSLCICTVLFTLRASCAARMHISSSLIEEEHHNDKRQALTRSTAIQPSSQSCGTFGQDLFFDMMKFNARTQFDASLELYFLEPSGRKGPLDPERNEFLEAVRPHLSAAAYEELRTNTDNKFFIVKSVEGKDDLVAPDRNGRYIRIWIRGRANSEMRTDDSVANWVSNLVLSENTLQQGGGSLQDYLEDPVHLQSILIDSALLKRHTSDNGLFSKGLISRTTKAQGVFGLEVKTPDCALRDYAGAVDFVTWLNNACPNIGNDMDMLEMTFEASLFSVVNQSFNKNNHRTSLFLVGLGMPEELAQPWAENVVDYAGSNSTSRAAIYTEMHTGWVLYQPIIPFNSPQWQDRGNFDGYSQVLQNWIADNGGGDWLEQRPAGGHGAQREVCKTQSDCQQPGFGCCDPTWTTFGDKHCGDGHCFCMNEKNKCE